MPTLNKTVLITGTSSGIGQSCALYLAQKGFRVFAGVRKETDAQQLRQNELNDLIPIFIDVTQPDMIEAAVQTITQEVGEAGLAGLVNNAGIAVGGPLEVVPMATLRNQLELNVVGQMAVTQAMLPLLRQGRGRIINISSISGRIAMPFFGPYSASKFALEALTDALRLELHPWGIKVVSIQPGAIVTKIWKKSLNKGDEFVDNLPPTAKRLYGKQLASLRRSVVRTAQGGIAPERVARVVHTALTTQRPSTRYLVGWDAKMGALFAKLTPDRLRDWVIRQQVDLAP